MRHRCDRDPSAAMRDGEGSVVLKPNFQFQGIGIGNDDDSHHLAPDNLNEFTAVSHRVPPF